MEKRAECASPAATVEVGFKDIKMLGFVFFRENCGEG
jgi:hypothetical protein